MKGRTVAFPAGVLAAVLGLHLGAGAQEPPRTLGPQSCQGANCHVKPNAWWPADDHAATFETFFSGGKYDALMTALGIDLSDFAAINSRCMSCHGTVQTGAEASPPEYGVSCESCHGPAGQYLKPHQEKGAIERSYAGLGLYRLEDPAVRAAVCVDCHYIPDKTLIDVNHPAGWGLDEIGQFTRGIEKKISRHWETPAGPESGDPYIREVNAKGYPPPDPPGVPAPGAAGVTTRTEYVTVYVGRKLSPLFFPERPLAGLELAPFLDPPDPGSPGSILDTVRSRLEYLHAVLDSSIRQGDD